MSRRGTPRLQPLAASLLFAMRKFKNDPGWLRATAKVHRQRNEQKRLRIASIDVDLHLGVDAAGLVMLDSILAQLEDFCLVTQSVRDCFAVNVRVFDASATELTAR